MRTHLFVLITFICMSAQAKTVVYGKAPILVTVPYGKELLFKFDKQVRTISPVSGFNIRPASSDTPDYTTMSVTAKDPLGDALIGVILEDDSSVKIRLKSVQTENRDLVDPLIEFKAREVFQPSDAEASKASEIDLMRALLRDDYASGFDRRELDRVVESAQKGVSARLIRQYEGQGLHGYVFKLTNQSQFKNVTIDLRQVKLGKPNLAILSQVDQMLLRSKSSGRNETILRVVAKSSARYSDIRIPFGEKKPQEVKK